MADDRPIFLLGDDGQIGWELARLLPALGPVESTAYPDVDLARPDALRERIRRAAPRIIVNAAAYTAVDKAEQEPDVAAAVNARGPAMLAEEARRLDAWLVHYSTDFVFDGAAGCPYTETDAPNPLSVYGRTKLDGDRAVMAAGGRFLIFRVSWIYGRRGRNFLLTMRRLAAERGAVRVVADQVGTPTWCRAVAEKTLAALERVAGTRADLDPDAASGLYHMTCAGSTTWHGFARAFLPPEVDVAPIATSEYPTPARRPPYSVLDCSRLHRTFGLKMPDWRDALQRCLDDPRFADGAPPPERSP